MFWGGGSVALATSADDFHVLKCRPSERLEDGTVNFLDIAALRHGFELMQGLGGITAIQVGGLGVVGCGCWGCWGGAGVWGVGVGGLGLGGGDHQCASVLWLAGAACRHRAASRAAAADL